MGVWSTSSEAMMATCAQVVGTANVCPVDQITATWQSAIARAVTPNQAIAGLVFPTTQAELAAIVTCAHQHQWRILPCGAGSKLDWGGLVGEPQATESPMIAISTDRLNRLIDHAVGDLTVTVEAGMKFADLQARLAQAGQFLAIDPAFPDQATIGGIVATADTGSLRQRYASVRDMLLGISFVRADGQLAKAGGRVVKNVAGYDLMKLFTGSYGTLGVISQVTFRVYPLPEASQTVILSGTAAAIAQATQTLLSSVLTPTSCDLVAGSVAQELAIAGEIGLLVRFQGLRSSVLQQVERVIEVGKALGLHHTAQVETSELALWQQLREQMTIASRDQAITCKIGVCTSAAGMFLQQLPGLGLSAWSVQIHAASGLGRLTLAAPDLPMSTLLKIRSLCQATNGFLSILQAPVSCKQQVDVWGYAGNALEMMQRIKQQFDPNPLLSPHRFVGGI
ncbi:FAD-binding oxidoreductase [Pantanalinema sp. GBBB05]|uniref:FAD-binding oxidoreductase n=1 Tax=Pantanalinema sp. GBBB05 TaxID=2604139 RepID=UPI001DEE89CD|nr:FAD-binding oxidoreductase [Pantanalinema sp. GBBB05]